MKPCTQPGCNEPRHPSKNREATCKRHARMRHMQKNARRDGKTVPTTEHLEACFGTHCPECETKYDSAPGRNTVPTLQHWPDGRMTVVCQLCNVREALFRRYPLPLTNEEKRARHRANEYRARAKAPSVHRERARRSRERHAERINEARRKKIETDGDHIRAQARARYAANPEPQRASARRQHRRQRLARITQALQARADQIAAQERAPGAEA